jgi:ribosomally synthesized peptide (two-chain TOMM family)
MGMDDMMRFRTAYLRAIARAWSDEAFFRAMTSWKTNGYDGWSYLPSPLPRWNVELLFAADVLPGNGYRPDLTGSWVGPGAIFTLRLPRAPAGDQVKALAAYYSEMPTPFGQGRPRVEGWIEPGEGTPEVGDSAGSGGAGMGHWNDALVLGGTVLRALALSWSDQTFSEQFFGKHAIDALQSWLGYTLPWNMQLEAEQVSDVTWNGKKWSPRPSNSLRLWVPNKPDTRHHALALASYNQTGNAYPLTCP